MQILERGVRRELNKRANSKAASFEREGCVRVQNGRDACAFGGMLPCPRSRCTHTPTHTHTHTHRARDFYQKILLSMPPLTHPARQPEQRE